MRLSFLILYLKPVFLLQTKSIYCLVTTMCCVDAEFKMRGGPLKLVATVGGVLVGGLFTLSFATSVSMHAFQAIIEAKKVQIHLY